LHIGDTGLATALPGFDVATLIKERDMLGQLLETFVFQESRRQASWNKTPVQFHHFRDKDGVEVDIVLEQAGKITGIEVKTACCHSGESRTRSEVKRYPVFSILFWSDGFSSF